MTPQDVMKEKGEEYEQRRRELLAEYACAMRELNQEFGEIARGMRLAHPAAADEISVWWEQLLYSVE